MTREETAQLLTGVKILWPHSQLGAPAEALRMWHALLVDVTPEEAEDAVKELALAGRDHAPGPGIVAAKVADRRAGVPEWDQAWEEVCALLRPGAYRKPQGDPYGPPPASAFSHPAIAAWAIPAWKEIARGPAPGTSGFGTAYAQARESYKAMAARTERDHRLALARVDSPRIEGGGMRRLNLAAAVPPRPELTEGSG